MATVPHALEKLAPQDKTLEKEAALRPSFVRSALVQPSTAEFSSFGTKTMLPRHQGLVTCQISLDREDRLIEVIQQLLMWDRALMTSKLRSLEVDIDKRFERVIQSRRSDTLGSSPEDEQEGACTLRMRNLGLDSSGAAIDQRIEEALREQERRLCKRFETMENDLKSRIEKVATVSNIAASTVLSAVEKMRESDERMAKLDQRVIRSEHQLDKFSFNDLKRSRSDLLGIVNAFSEQLTQSCGHENADVKVAVMQVASTPRQAEADTGLGCHTSQLTSSSSRMYTAAATASVMLPYIETTSCFSSRSSGAISPIGQSTIVISDVVRCDDSDMLPCSGIGILTGDQGPRPPSLPLAEASPRLSAECNNEGKEGQKSHDEIESRDQICDVFSHRKVVVRPPLAIGLVEGNAKSMVDGLNSTRKQVVVRSASVEFEIGSVTARSLGTSARSDVGSVAPPCDLFVDKMAPAASQAVESRNLKLNSALKVSEFTYGTPPLSDRAERKGSSDLGATQPFWRAVESLRGDIDRIGQEIASERRDWHVAFASIQDLIAQALGDAKVSCESPRLIRRTTPRCRSANECKKV